MKTILEDYAIFPKVARTGENTRVHIRPLGRHAAFEAGRRYAVNIIPMGERGQAPFHPFSPFHPYAEAHGMRELSRSEAAAKRVFRAVEVTADADGLVFDWRFPSEQEYVIEVLRAEDERRVAALRVYAVREDLYGLLPLKGNMHTHSFRSDGREAPEIVAAVYRKAGYDYIALTDHGQYAPSLEAIRAYDGAPIDMRLYPGEEVHAPDNNIHIINFGGESSVNDWMRENPLEYYRQCEDRRAALGLDDSFTAFEYASSQWVFDQIRARGGMAILAHPNWIWCDAYNIRTEIYERFLREGGYDALELLNGGNTPEENEMQVNLWQEGRAKGSAAIATGSDDSHGAINGQWFDIAWTYVLAETNDRDAIIGAIRARRCVAALRYHGESTHYYGDARMTAYFGFLDREYFPLHDELCVEEGRLMKAWVCGDPDAKARLAQLRGQTLRLARRLVGASWE